MSQKLILGYWNIRGLVDPLRFALEYAETDYQEKKYVMGQAPDFDRSQWTNEKHSLGLDFPNLPYIIDGDMKLTESIACLKYICRKYGMLPDSDKDNARADNVEGVLVGLRGSFFGQIFVPEEKYEAARQKYKENVYPDTMKKIVEFMGKNKWLISNKITYVDFLLYSLLDFSECLNPGCTKQFPRLEQYVKDFQTMPTIKRYLKSERFSLYPIINPVARWGYKRTG